VNAWLRRAGSGRLADGATLTWSVAEGSRGRRWRAQRLEDDVLCVSMLLEVDGAARSTRLEVDCAAGMLTLHPEPDWQAAHGNVVGREGVRPLSFDWSDDGVFVVDDVPIGEIAAISRLAPQIGVGERVRLRVLVVDRQLGVARAERSFVRLTDKDWRCESESLSIETDGTPRLPDGGSWELEPE
jgi:hypothetical protein